MAIGIILAGIANSGKTTSIDLFLKNYISLDDSYTLLYKVDDVQFFTNSIAIFRHIRKNKIIVVMPYGDTDEIIQKYYDEYIKFIGTDESICIDNIIIIGCSRTSGNTVNKHKDYCSKIYWLGKEKTYSFKEESIEVQNVCEATAISIEKLLCRVISRLI